MTITIRTTKIPATDTSSVRVRATIGSGQFKGKQETVSFDDSARNPYADVARKLADRLGIVGNLVPVGEHGLIFSVEPLPVVLPAVASPIVVTLLPRTSPITVKLLPRRLAQVVTRYARTVGKADRVGARVLSGPFSGQRIAMDWDSKANDMHVVAVLAVLAKAGIVGTVTESGAAIGNGFIYNVTN